MGDQLLAMPWELDIYFTSTVQGYLLKGPDFHSYCLIYTNNYDFLLPMSVFDMSPYYPSTIFGSLINVDGYLLLSSIWLSFYAGFPENVLS